MLDWIVAGILGASVVAFMCLARKSQENKKPQKRDSKGRFTKR